MPPDYGETVDGTRRSRAMLTCQMTVMPVNTYVRERRPISFVAVVCGYFLVGEYNTKSG